jgi:hypothetical protein
VQACGFCGPVAPALSHIFDTGQVVAPAILLVACE